MIILLLLFITFLGAAEAQAGNVTADQCQVNIPGYSHHHDCNLLCRPAAWTDILVFYLGNYFAHAATITTLPGQSVASSVHAITIALLLPGGGVMRAWDIISRGAKFASTPLQTAARAGALCAIVSRTAEEEDSVPTGNDGKDIQLQQRNTPGNPAADKLAEGGEVGGTVTAVDRAHQGPNTHVLPPLRAREDLPASIRCTKIHGVCRLPEGFDLMVVHQTATFRGDVVGPKLPIHRRLAKAITSPFKPEPAPETALSCNYNIVKVIIAVVQFAFAISTLYKTWGDQIAIYGYAAFGLTVVPYAWMTLLNLLANMMCPQYDAMFVVKSSGYDELRNRLNRATEEERANFMVDGTVGRLTATADKELRQHYECGTGPSTANKPRYTSNPVATIWRANAGSILGFVITFVVFILLSILFSAFYFAPLIIVGAISRFEANESALDQRVWTMMWLADGLYMGSIFLYPYAALESRPLLNKRASRRQPFLQLGTVIGFFVSVIPPIGGFVVVGQMINEFGVCSLLLGSGRNV